MSEIKIPQVPDNPCYQCGSREFWVATGDWFAGLKKWQCIRCQPPLNEHEIYKIADATPRP